MASKPSLIPLLLPENELLCSICQSIISDPVTIPCGHNFCMACIKTHWSRAYSSVYCPHCRRKFSSKPDLHPNTVLCAIMEHVEKVWPDFGINFEIDEKPIDCDICEEGRELTAVKTCVTCLASFCTVHVIPHTKSQALAKHCLCTPVADIKELLCKKHGKVLELFCMTHRAAICWQCTAKHRNCRTRLVEEMRTDWKAAIDPVEEAAQDRENATDEALEALHTILEGVTEAAEKMMEDVELCFEVLRNTIKHAQNRAIAFIEAEKVGVLQQITEQNKQLDGHMLTISLIKDKIAECRSNDSYFNFCLPLPLLPPEVSQLQDVQLDGRAVERMIMDLQHLNSSLESQLNTVLQKREEVRDKDLTSEDFRVVSGHSKRRCNLLKYSSGVTFDQVTASASVLLSEDGLAVTVEHSGLLTWKDYQVNTEIGFRVLCSQEFSSGQHYWEVQPPEDMDSNWAVGVTYKNKQEHYQSLGQDNSSWCVRWQNKGNDKDKDGMCNYMEGTEDGEAISRRTQAKEVAAEFKGSQLESEKSKGEAHLKEENGQKLESLQQDKQEREEIHVHMLENVEDEEKNESGLTKENKCIVTPQEHENVPKKASTGFFASHNQEMHLISQTAPGKIGVLLDCDRGCLSFFLVSNSKVRLCYRFQALFSASLYPAIWLRDPERTMTISKGFCTAKSGGKKTVD